MDINAEFATELRMLRQAVEAIPESKWREPIDDYLIPVRLYYHIFLGLEWLTSCFARDPEEHKRTRRYGMNWLGAVDEMPDQATALRDLAWIEEEIAKWSETVCRPREEKEAKALYFLRHTRQHLGELFATMRLLGVERPKWEWPGPNVQRAVAAPDEKQEA